jgi:hypothetical protein
MPAENPSVRPNAEFNLSAIPNGREDIARLIVKSFADAGFGGSQQIAALANAIAESNLNPAARSAPPDEGVGLFQLNRAALGAGAYGSRTRRPREQYQPNSRGSQKIPGVR